MRMKRNWIWIILLRRVKKVKKVKKVKATKERREITKTLNYVKIVNIFLSILFNNKHVIGFVSESNA